MLPSPSATGRLVAGCNYVQRDTRFIEFTKH